MSLISLNIKQQIIENLNGILNLQDESWTNLNTEIKLKVIHNLCNNLNKQTDISTTKITIPLKNLRPKKIIQFCGINKKTNSIIYDDYRKKLIEINKDFRINYNSSNKNYCFANLSKSKYDGLLNNFNYNIYMFLTINVKSINHKLFYHNLIGNNYDKVICTNNSSYSENISCSNIKLQTKLQTKSHTELQTELSNNLKIRQINCNEKFLNIEFNNGVMFQLELYLTSEKITNNIPAKYKINLINIF
jgi:hypothetical protein